MPNKARWQALIAGLLFAITLALPIASSAHPAPFSYLDLHFSPSGVDGTLVVHDIDVAHDFGIDPPERLRDTTFAEQYRAPLMRLMASRLTLLLDDNRGALQWTGFETLPDRHSLRLRFKVDHPRPSRAVVRAQLFPYDPVHQTFINVYENGALRHQTILDGRRTSADYYAGSWQGTAAVIAVFLPAGIEHILIGPDHLLFLIGLLLLGGSVRRLALIVTAFTLGHSITLSLAALNLLSPPEYIIEPLIALSIVFVGADNLLVQRSAVSGSEGWPNRRSAATRAPRDIRAWSAGAFGLIHGFGFANVLRELGLPASALGASLFSFNVGVELGQLAVVLVAALLLEGLRRQSPDSERRLVIVGSSIVIAAGSFWFVQRVL